MGTGDGTTQTVAKESDLNHRCVNYDPALHQGPTHGRLEKNEKNKMIGYLSSSSSDASAEIVGDSNPQTLCTRRDERYVCSLISVPLLGDMLRLVCLGLQRHLEELKY